MARRMKEVKVPTEQEVNVGYDYNEDASLSPEEAQAKIAMLLARSDNLKTLSETTEDEVKLISALSTLGKTYKIPLLNSYIDNYLELKVSLHRQGRKEIADISRPTTGSEERAKSSLRQMLTGGRL
jgi:hypothetical protein